MSWCFLTFGCFLLKLCFHYQTEIPFLWILSQLLIITWNSILFFKNKHFPSLTRVYCCNTCHTVVAQGEELILVGDFNCCLMSSTRNNTDCQQLKSLFRYSDLKQLITSPTRISKDSKSLVDLTFWSHNFASQ